MDELKIGKESIDGSVSLELSYNHLGDLEQEKQAKLIFRTIGLLGVPNVSILTLLKYGVGLGLFGGNTSDNIMERARREITTSVRILQDSSLLLESDDIDHVKIHDVVRDVAVGITSRDDHALIFNSDDDMKRWSKEKLRKSTAISLPYGTLRKLNMRWKCPNITIFIMDARAEKHGGDGPIELPNLFLKNTGKLRIIHLKNVRLALLPSSIRTDLRDITTLCLHDCYVENIAVIGELKSLQVLSFIGSDITHLPIEIGGLTKLRMLDLSKCSKLVTMEPGILEKLTRLEELYLKESFDRWEVQGGGKQSNSSLDELNKLQLSSLEVRIRDTITLPPNLPFRDLVHYKVLIGDAWDWSVEFKEVRTLKFKVDSDDALTTGWLQSSLEKTQDLHLDGLGGSCESFHELCTKEFKELKHLHLQNSSSIKYIIWSTDWLACSSFTVLESMNLEWMKNLETISVGLISSTSFSKLKFIKLHECEKLKNLFSLSLAKGLAELEEIEVSSCNKIQEVVFAELMDDNDGSTREDHNGCDDKSFDAKDDTADRNSEIILRNLRSLVLRNLVEMITFFNKEAEPIETNAPTFFNEQQVSLQRSKFFKLFSSSKPKKMQPSIHLELGNLGRLELEECNKIEHFINSRILLKLLNLESLTIMRCESLEDVFDLEGIDAKSGTIEILPKLSELKLRGLPKLQHIWKNAQKTKGCPKLRTFEIHQCESLIYLSSSSMCEGMENLMEMNIVECGKMKTIFWEEDGLASDASTLIRLTSLKILVISKCPNLEGFLSSNLQGASMAFKCSNPGMTHWCCGKQDLADTSNSFFSHKVFLPNLESLVLSNAGKFEKLWCNEVPDQSYSHLEFVNVEKCNALLTVFPASLVERLQNLKQIRVEDCNSLETVVDLAITWKTKKKPTALMLTRLEEVGFFSLESLIHIVDKDSGIVVGFPSLKKLTVVECSKLIYLVPATAATTLLKLETLEIYCLKNLKEVIHGEVGGRNKRNIITFPNLTSLNMQALDNLICFSLKPRLNGEGSQDEDSCTLQDKLYLITRIQVEELWCNNELIAEGFFCNLKFINILGCSRLRNIIPISMIKRLQNLESILVQDCESIEDIINMAPTQLEEESIVDVDDTIIRLSKLTSFRIYGGPHLSIRGAYTLELPSLQDLCFSSTTGAAVSNFIQKAYLPNLEQLQIWRVKDITELWSDDTEEPPIGSFCKLKCLTLGECSELEKKIFPYFMLKRLHNLDKLEVEKCSRLETISELSFGGEDQDNKSNFLQNLTSVHVKNCPCFKNLLSIISEGYHDGHGETRIVPLPELTSLRLVDLPAFSHFLEGVHHNKYILEMSSLKEFFLIRSGADHDEAITHLLKQGVVFPKDVKVVFNEDSFFGSTTDVFTKVKEALQSHQIIGVLGWWFSFSQLTGLKHLLKEEAKLFDIFLRVNALSDADEIQERIGNGLDIIYSEAGLQRRAQHLRKSLLSLKDKRIVLIWDGLGQEMDLEAIGIPQNNDLLHLKQILVSTKREVLDKMGAQHVIDFWDEVQQRWLLFAEELEDSKALFPKEVFPVDSTNTKSDIIIPSIFVGSTTAFINNIMKALHPRQKNDQIIGILGRNENMSNLLHSICNQVQKEANLFDDVLRISISQQDDAVTHEIQQQFGSKLSINYCSDETITGVQERAQQLRAHLLSNIHQDKKRMLVIIEKELDDAIDLEAVGIPRGDELDPKLLKIILVSNKREVLNEMGVQQVIHIGNITFSDEDDKEDIRCFRILDGYVAGSELKKLADECGSNDLVQRLVKKLKKQGLVGWANAFERLQESTYTYEARRKVIDTITFIH